MPMIVGLGLLVTFYTMLGGIRAVIWTDVTQFCIMFVGLTGTLLICWWNVPGGFRRDASPAAWQVGQASTPTAASPRAACWRVVREFFTTPVTAASMFFTLLVARLGTYTSDQVMIQRFQTTRSIRDARQGFLITAVSDTVWMTALAAVGLALFAYFQHHPLPAAVQGEPRQHLPVLPGRGVSDRVDGPGHRGDSGRLAFEHRLGPEQPHVGRDDRLLPADRLWVVLRPDEDADPQQQRRQVLVSRLVTVVLGIVGTALSCNVSRLGNDLRDRPTS